MANAGCVKMTTMILNNLLAAFQLEDEPAWGYTPEYAGVIICVNLKYLKLLGVTRMFDGELCFENGDLRIPVSTIAVEDMAMVIDLKNKSYESSVSITDRSMAKLGFSADRPGIFTKGDQRLVYDYSNQRATFYDDRGMVFQDFRLFTIDQVKIVLGLCK